MNSIKGIIFDMDGTMVDNMMVHHRAWQRKLASLGIDMPMEEVMEKVHGVNEEILAGLFPGRFTPAERKQIAKEKEEEYQRIFLPELKLINGLPEFLEKLTQASIPLAIGTAAPPENVDFVLDNLNIRQYFKGVFHAGSVSQGKPNPEIFQKAAASMDLSTQSCMVFEDSPIGVETAKRAGCKSIVVTTTHSKEEFQHFDHVMKFISDYTKLEIDDIF